MKNEFSKRNIYPSPAKSFGFALEPIETIKNDALIVLDANVLLLPFTTNIKNVEAIKAVYGKLVESDKIFLPAQAVREYLDNRAKKLSDMNEALQKKASQSFNYVGAHPLLESLEEFKFVLELEGELKKTIKDYQSKIRETLSAVQKWGWNDPVSKMYHKVLAERVLDDKDIDVDEISKDLENRNTLRIPPGYKDQNKEQNQAGDLLIWHEILKIAIEKEQHVIFVSGDDKVDWWHQSGKSPLYPRFELVDEFREKTSGKSFHIVSLSRLLELFETDQEVVESIKSSEEEAKSEPVEDTPPKKRTPSYDPNCEYRKYLKIPISHGLFVSHEKWNVKGGYDTDTYSITEINEKGEVENEYQLFDSTKITPPFSREIYGKKI
ncbi:PIN domain-containing protein [Shewanella sp. PP-He15 brown]